MGHVATTAEPSRSTRLAGEYLRDAALLRLCSAERYILPIARIKTPTHSAGRHTSTATGESCLRLRVGLSKTEKGPRPDRTHGWTKSPLRLQ